MQDIIEIISEIKDVWPACKIVHGCARHSQSQGGIERLNRTCEGKLATWMSDNKSTKWSVGRLFVRWQINTAYTEATGRSPYFLTYGQEPRVGITSLPLAPELVSTLSSEADLNKAFGLDENAIIEEAAVADLHGVPVTTVPAVDAAAATTVAAEGEEVTVTEINDRAAESYAIEPAAGDEEREEGEEGAEGEEVTVTEINDRAAESYAIEPAAGDEEREECEDGAEGANLGLFDAMPATGLMDVSPNRKRAREKAAGRQELQARRMQARTAAKEGQVAVGTVVHIAVDDVDRAKVDDHNLTLVVVELAEKGIDQKEIKYRLAGKAGVLKTLYTRSYIKPLPNATPTLMGLQSTLDGWRELEQDVSIRTLAKSTSQVGGQGVVQCSCKGKCDKNTCSCFKANRKCTSRCHNKNNKCTNQD